jgi:hypothetical protein
VSSASFTQHIHDQLNHRRDFLTVVDHLRKARPYEIVESGNVLNYVTWVMRLTRGKLTLQDDWSDWQHSEYLQLDQYDKQGMFGVPIPMKEKDVVFHLVWTYAIKVVDGREKARCVCNGSTCSGMVRVLDETYVNCVDQTSSRLFYAISAAENLLIFGADVSNAFAEAPLQNRGSSSGRTKPSVNGGLTKTAPPYQMDMSSLSFLQCRGIPNPHTSEKSMPTPYSVKLGLLRQCTNHAFTPESSKASACSLCDKFMTLPLPRSMLELLVYSWI